LGVPGPEALWRGGNYLASDTSRFHQTNISGNRLESAFHGAHFLARA